MYVYGIVPIGLSIRLYQTTKVPDWLHHNMLGLWFCLWPGL
ncbi:hypothetical protein HanIR_Chr12g0605811 [Helianthus annuus]|nr:hypothetical protein HanIR_Chr12g0605811 [Helianthus annuus]